MVQTLWYKVTVYCCLLNSPEDGEMRVAALPSLTDYVTRTRFPSFRGNTVLCCAAGLEIKKNTSPPFSANKIVCKQLDLLPLLVHRIREDTFIFILNPNTLGSTRKYTGYCECASQVKPKVCLSD